MRRVIALAAAAGCLAAPAAASAQQQAGTINRNEAARTARVVLGLAGSELLLRDERSRVFVTSSVRVERGRDCARPQRNIADCAFTVVLVGTNPEPGETAERTRTTCTGEVRVRRTNRTQPARYTLRLRDYQCRGAAIPQQG